MRKPFEGNFPITQTFGNKLVLNGVDFYAQWGLKGHNGIDYGTPTGTEILAPHKGTIKEAYFDENGYGWYVKIENDIEGSVLGHMLSLSVKVGDTVEEGQKVGISDNTGASTGPHLHWGYYRFPRDRNNGYNGYIDQTSYIAVIADPTHDTNSAGDYGTPIKTFLVNKGYTYPETHLDVIKVMYESDLKLKSGQYITKEDCNKEKKDLQEKFDKEKESWNADKEKEKNEAITLAVNNAKIEWDKQLEGQYQEYLKVKDTNAYKICMSILTLLKIKKLEGGESNGTTESNQ
jgi:murein DD-endopeptidase MepM/ murein hydrolase activator NlpD